MDKGERMTESERCQNCDFWALVKVDGVNEEDDEGCCWRFPPVYIGGDPKGVSNWQRPMTYGFEACGEFKPREGPPEE